MIRKRARSKQALMADPYQQKQSKSTSFSRLFTAFNSFNSFTSSENDAVTSPASTLDLKPFPVPGHSKFHELVPKPIGLAIVDSLLEDGRSESECSPTGSKNILFGSQLRIQIPQSPRAPADFGIKTRSSSRLGSTPVSESGQDSTRIFSRYPSPAEMELSEEYTCVISHGLNPRTIHIFDNFIVESENDDVLSRSPDAIRVTGSDYWSPGKFLSICWNCKKKLGPREDIFMYRGERAFCSNECRSEEMMLEEENMK